MRDLSNKISSATNADFNNYVYTRVYASANATPTINGTVVTMVGGSSIEILVKSISATPNVYVIGQKRINVPTVIGKSEPRPFIITVKTDNAGTSSSTQFTIPTNPLYRGVYDIETSDGQVYKNVSGDKTLTFPTAGTYDIKISGNFASIYFNNEGDKAKLLDIKQWGDVVWRSMVSSFRGCTSLTNITAKDAPVLSSFKFEPLPQSSLIYFPISDLVSTFSGCSNLTNINFMANWDMSQVRNISSLFRECSSITDWSGMANWDVSNLKYLNQTFLLVSSFNDDAMEYIRNWDVSNVISMIALFAITSITTTEPLSNWDVSNVENLNQIFQQTASLNSLEGLENWNVSKVKSMSSSFRNTSITSLDNLENWNTKSLTNMSVMFYQCRNLASIEGVENWNVSNVERMDFLFRETAIVNANLSKWNVSNVKNASQLFNICTSLEVANISGWKIPNLRDMSFMFNQCTNLVTVIGVEDLDVSKVVTLDSFIERSPNFDQSLAKWDITEVSNLIDLMRLNNALSRENYDGTIISWEAQLQAKYPNGEGYTKNINTNFGASKYVVGSEAAAARQSLIDNFGWVINDGGALV